MTLPLAAAAERLRGKPGRPPLSPEEKKARRAATRQAREAAKLAAVPVRLFDVAGAARYASLSPWTIRDLIDTGKLPRVRLPLPSGGELRRVLVDRDDLDGLIETWKDGAGR